MTDERIDLEKEMKNFAEKLNEAVKAAERVFEAAITIDQAEACIENRSLMSQSHVLLTSHFGRSLAYATILVNGISDEVGYTAFMKESSIEL